MIEEKVLPKNFDNIIEGNNIPQQSSSQVNNEEKRSLKKNELGDEILELYRKAGEKV